MFKRLVFTLIVMVLILLGISACKPVCTPGQLIAPQIENPQSGSLFDHGTDSLEWSWPNQNCVPEGYLLEIVDTDQNSWEDPLHSVTLDGLTTSWNFDSPPPAATKYWWRVSAFADNDYGPTTSDHQYFITGPVCTGSALIPPSPRFPSENGIETNPAGVVYTCRYEDISCVPEGFKLTVSRTEDMSVVVGGHDKFSIIKHPPQSPTMWICGAAPAINHLDCTEYFWTLNVVSGGTEGPPSPARRFTTDYGNGCSCDTNAITMAMMHGPDDYGILPGTTAQLRWYNHGGCFPDGAAVQIATAPDFSNAIEVTIAGQHVSQYEALNLLPATQYHWKAGYYMEDNGGQVMGTYSQSRTFFTGPECTTQGELTAPALVGPANGSVVNTLTPTLYFTPGSPGCVPDGYLLHLHETADFSDPNQMGETSILDTSVKTKTLEDCTTYHWSVTSVQDGEYGPESDHGTFSVDLNGTCSSSGMGATAINNLNCREGTYPEHHDVLWTFKPGEHTLAIARNPFNTYLKLVVLDQETKQPLKEFISCWGLMTALRPGWQPDDPPPGQDDFGDLPIEEPPVTPTPGTQCSAYTIVADCEAAGCTWHYTSVGPGYCSGD